MNPRLSIDQLEQLKSIMHLMLIEAKAENWPELSRLDGERRIILNYPEHARELHPSALSEPAISSGQRPFALTPAVRAAARPDTSGSLPADDTDSRENQPLADDGYRALSKDVLELDSAIRKTIEDAKEALLKESRGMRAQVNAKKGYEKTSNMSPCSYS